MIVMKFGGTSVKDVAAVRRLVDIIRREKRPKVVVVSALSKVTDALIEVGRLAEQGDAEAAAEAVRALHRRHQEMCAVVTSPERRPELVVALDELFAELSTIVHALAVVEEVSPRSADTIVSFGELASSRIVAAAFEDAGLRGRFVDARQVLVTDAQHGAAQPDRAATDERLRSSRAPARRAGAGAGARRLHRRHDDAASRRRSAAEARTTRRPSSAPGSRPRRSRSGPTSTACSPPTRGSSRARASSRSSASTRPRSSPTSAPRCSTPAPSCRRSASASRCAS